MSIKNADLSKMSIFDVFEPLICSLCNKSFEKKTEYKIHIKSHRFDDHTYELKKGYGPDSRKYECIVCQRRFAEKKNLLKHLRVIHKNVNEAEKLKVKKTKCPESMCMFVCGQIRDLRHHVEKCHGIKVLKDNLQFSDEASFLKWKKHEEDNSTASFVSFRGKIMLKDGVVKQTLSCHRTGQYSPRGTGRHRLKAHGSCKIGGTCPASIDVFQYPDGQVMVTYHKTHLGHSQDAIHLHLSKEEKADLSEKIKQGFSFDAILEDIEESIDETGKKKRIHLLSKKDLSNIIQNENSNKKMSNSKTNNVVIRDGVGDDIHKTMIDCDISETDNAETKGVNNIVIPKSEGPNDASQIIILPSDVTAPDVILLQQTQTLPQNLTKPPKTAKQCDAKESKSQLTLKIQEKVQRLSSLTQKSEFLTPRQYEMINRKLDSIIGVLDSVNVRKKWNKKKSRTERKDEQANGGEAVLECVVPAQNAVRQVYEAPVYAYLYNYNC